MSLVDSNSFQAIEYIEECPEEDEDEQEEISEKDINFMTQDDNEKCYLSDDQQPEDQRFSKEEVKPLESQIKISDIDVWLESIKASMLKLTKLNQARAKRDINNILSNYEIEQLENVS